MIFPVGIISNNNYFHLSLSPLKCSKTLTAQDSFDKIKAEETSVDGYICTDADEECKAKDPSKCRVHGAKSGNPDSGRYPKGSGKLKDNPNISAIGENKFRAGFSAKNLDSHWVGGVSDHSKQYPGYTKEQYAEEALTLIQSATSDSIKGYKNNSGQVVRYDITNNNFVKGHPEHGIATMFKPKAGKVYFERLKDSDAIKEE